MRVAVIITTYNRPDALGAVLEGFLAQTPVAFEVIIADDGSTPDTAGLIADFVRCAPFPLHHVWQEDIGFRAGAARNRALGATTADYVIFTDGDCVPPPFFVARHRELAEPGCFLAGNRCLLSERFTTKVLEQHLPIHGWRTTQWLKAWIRGDINRWLPLLDLPEGAWRKRTPERWEGVKTCNLSAWRADLLRINGFDESYAGWGLEDSDLVIRLLHAGIRHKNARFAAPVFHLWHREQDRSSLPENRRRLEEILAGGEIRATRGLEQYQ